MFVIDKRNSNAVCRINLNGSVEQYVFSEASWLPCEPVSEEVCEISEADVENLIKAYALAKKVHEGQTDKAGKPYITHPTRVAQLVDGGPTELMVAFLHDVVEDTPTTLEDLRNMGFDEVVVSGVDGMTRRAGETRDAYLKRLKPNPIARAVKLADLVHNSDLSRISAPSEKDYRRVEEYRKEIAYLKK